MNKKGMTTSVMIVIAIVLFLMILTFSLFFLGRGYTGLGTGVGCGAGTNIPDGVCKSTCDSTKGEVAAPGVYCTYKENSKNTQGRCCRSEANVLK